MLFRFFGGWVMSAFYDRALLNENILQTVAVVVPCAVASPMLPQIELGFCVLPVSLVAPGIMTQSNPFVFLPSAPYPQQEDCRKYINAIKQFDALAP
jgi:hypothetical protein